MSIQSHGHAEAHLKKTATAKNVVACKTCCLFVLAALYVSSSVSSADPRLAPLAAPATPLIANDPFFQTYSPRGDLNANPTVAGSNGREQQMLAMLWAGSSKPCQLMGSPSEGFPQNDRE